MHSLLKMFGKTISYASVFAFACTCAMAENVRSGVAAGGSGTRTAGRGTSNAVRIPTMPILPQFGTGNVSTNRPTTYVSDTSGNTDIVPDDGNNGNNGDNGNNNGNNGNNGDNGNNGNNNGNAANNCDLSYTIDACMADIYACVNGGALPNGINSMFDDRQRQAIFDGMGLCQSQVDYCIANVRLPKNDGNGCVYLYGTAKDVWFDFNARRIQPEYYAFVMRRTGLTPYQAERTCALLDRNTYGASFNAVGSDYVTSEYGNGVYAYNGAGGNRDGEQKKPTMGPSVNEYGTYDTERGYYARWDAQNAQCLVRVAAYNKNDLITNRILWGLGGDNSPAEVWKSTGDSFTCNKDLFGFNLRKKTEEVATVAVPGLTGVGVGLGALAASNKIKGLEGDRIFDCENEDVRNALTERFRQNTPALTKLQTFIKQNDITVQKGEGVETLQKDKNKNKTEDTKNKKIKKTDEDLKLWLTGSPVGKNTCEYIDTLHEFSFRRDEYLDVCDVTLSNYGLTPELFTPNVQKWFELGCPLEDLNVTAVSGNGSSRSSCLVKISYHLYNTDGAGYFIQINGNQIELNSLGDNVVDFITKQVDSIPCDKNIEIKIVDKDGKPKEINETKDNNGQKVPEVQLFADSRVIEYSDSEKAFVVKAGERESASSEKKSATSISLEIKNGNVVGCHGCEEDNIKDICDAVRKSCQYKNFNQLTVKSSNTNVFCDGPGQACINRWQFEKYMNELQQAFAAVEDVFSKGTGYVSEKEAKKIYAKDMAIGGAIGAGTGGAVTAIAAIVEGSRINCRVGDDLARVDLNKSYRIESLRDFYVKWALNMPTTPVSTNERSIDVVTNCGNWDAICKARGAGDYGDSTSCSSVQVNYLPTGVYTPRLVTNACVRATNGDCGINWTTAKRYGIMGRDATCPDSTPDSTSGGTTIGTATADQNIARY